MYRRTPAGRMEPLILNLFIRQRSQSLREFKDSPVKLGSRNQGPNTLHICECGGIKELNMDLAIRSTHLPWSQLLLQ